MNTEFEVVTVCGSMRYWEKMLILAQELTGDGYIVLMPFVADYAHEKHADERKAMLDDMHIAKMGLSNAIYVVGAHRGESTVREIEWAKNHSLTIHYRFQTA